jgi:hypothetical protein
MKNHCFFPSEILGGMSGAVRFRTLAISVPFADPE